MASRSTASSRSLRDAAQAHCLVHAGLVQQGDGPLPERQDEPLGHGQLAAFGGGQGNEGQAGTGGEEVPPGKDEPAHRLLRRCTAAHRWSCRPRAERCRDLADERSSMMPRYSTQRTSRTAALDTCRGGRRRREVHLDRCLNLQFISAVLLKP